MPTSTPPSGAPAAPGATGATGATGDAPSAGVATLRTLALVGSAAAGKTTLVDALLAAAGAIGAAGSVERGTTTSDFDPQEKRALHSLRSSLMHLTHGATRIHLIDTPGTADFLGQALPALEAVKPPRW